MSRASTTMAGKGHNGPPLTDDEIAALQHYYASDIRRKQKAVGEAEAVLKTKRTAVNSSFALVKAHLVYSRKEFEEVLAAEEMGEREFLVKEAARARRLQLHGLKPGDQVPLDFDTVTEAMLAEADGYRAGLRDEEPKPPEHVSGILHPDWMRGWHRGDVDAKEKVSLAERILAIWNEQDGSGLEAADEDDEDEDEDGDAELEAAAEEVDPQEEIDRQARKLKEEGWTEPTPEERSFAQADGEQAADDAAAPEQVVEALDA
ncbi:MAG: hypothetical protein HY859_06835 [Caulobacterales bacterium]|nr:hypothetical protein [Caulobacterales bacterium]